MQGKEYKGMTKIDGHYKFTVERPERVMKERKCSRKCQNCSSIGEEERRSIFNQFWNNMDWDQKKVYILTLVDVKGCKQKKQDEDVSRQFANPCFCSRLALTNILFIPGMIMLIQEFLSHPPNDRYKVELQKRLLLQMII